MTKVTLPRTNQTGTNEWADVEANDTTLAEKINGGLDNENLAAGANIARSQLASDAQGIVGKWYAPSVVATEQTRESTTFGAMSTPDEITGVVLPANGLIRIGFLALVKNSVSGAGRIGVFLGSNAAANINAETELSIAGGTSFVTVSSAGGGLAQGSFSGPSFGTSGGVLSGTIDVFAAAGTYAVSVRYRSTSGSITAKERKLWVETHGS